MLATALRQTRDNIQCHFTTTAAGIATTSFSLIILGTFVLVYLNLIHLTQFVFEKSAYSIFLTEDADAEVKDAIKNHLRNVWGIANVHEVSAEEARDQLVSNFGESGRKIEKLDFLKFPDIIEFTLDRPNALSERELEEMETLEGVSEVVFGRETRDQLYIFFSIANFVGVFLIVLLLVSIVLIIHNSIQIALRIRIREIEILKILGATSGFIRLPYIFEGIIIAISGYLISLVFIYLLFQFVIAGVTFNEATYSIRQLFRFFSLKEMGNILLLLVIIGLISSLLASNKIIRELNASQE